MNRSLLFSSFLLIVILLNSCSQQNKSNLKIRSSFYVNDGFTAQKFDLIMGKIIDEQNDLYQQMNLKGKEHKINNPRLTIAPHDDMALVGYIYPSLFQYIKSKTVFVLGVAHKARNYELEDQLIFDGFDQWDSPKGVVNVSEYREQVIKNLSNEDFVVHDEMQQIEHSVESILPYLQYFNPNVEIVSILVPYMNYDRMKYLAKNLSAAIAKVADQNQLEWGADYSIVISTDAVHYGDQGWSGSNYDRYGVDEHGYQEAMMHEWEIINTSLAGDISEDKIQKFINYTVLEEDYKTYKWTWCGRYCIPFGLLTSTYLRSAKELTFLNGIPLAYSTSIENKVLDVKNIVDYEHAQADLHHWVGYPAIVYN